MKDNLYLIESVNNNSPVFGCKLGNYFILACLLIILFNCNNKVANNSSNANKLIDTKWLFNDSIAPYIVTFSDNDTGQVFITGLAKDTIPFNFMVSSDDFLEISFRSKSIESTSKPGQDSNFDVLSLKLIGSKEKYQYQIRNDSLFLSTVGENEKFNLFFGTKFNVEELEKMKNETIELHPMIKINLPIIKEIETQELTGNDYIELYVGNLNSVFSEVYGDGMFYGSSDNIVSSLNDDLRILAVEIERQKIDLSFSKNNNKRVVLILDESSPMKVIKEIIYLLKYSPDSEFYLRVSVLNESSPKFINLNLEENDFELKNIQDWINQKY